MEQMIYVLTDKGYVSVSPEGHQSIIKLPRDHSDLGWYSWSPAIKQKTRRNNPLGFIKQILVTPNNAKYLVHTHMIPNNIFVAWKDGNEEVKADIERYIVNIVCSTLQSVFEENTYAMTKDTHCYLKLKYLNQADIPGISVSISSSNDFGDLEFINSN